MSFWLNAVSALFKRKVSKKKQPKKNAYKNTNKSAITSGRMRITNKIKGSQSKIPQKAGMYRHVDRITGEIEYVGQTNNLRVRQQQHAREGKLDISKHDVHYSVAKNEATKDDLCDTEKAHIKKNKPSGNKTKGGNGKR
ncbi:MAG: GIY-YIG nuclease family protein [Psychromonas sp.]